MKILVISIGSRGDVEPLLAIGSLLKKRDHQVFAVLPEQFRELAEESGLEFESLGPEFIELLESDVGKKALGAAGSGFSKILAYIKLAKKSFPINKLIFLRQVKIIDRINPDRIIYNGKAIYPVIWGLNKPETITLESPVPYLHYVKGHAHVAFTKNYGEIINRFTYWLAEFGLASTIKKSISGLEPKPRISTQRIKSALRSNRGVYTISPSLFSRPEYWGSNLRVMGYPEREKKSNFNPEAELLNFLNQNPKVVFVTFGSMTNPDPEGKTRALMEAFSGIGAPAIFNTAFGGLMEPEEYDQAKFHFIKGIPYDWIFPRVYAVVHHGGAGTTHLALKYGCPSMIIPHIIDQFVWDKIIAEKGAGPKGVRIEKISAFNLVVCLKDLFENEAYLRQAKQIAEHMKLEDFENELVDFILNPKKD